VSAPVQLPLLPLGLPDRALMPAPPHPQRQPCSALPIAVQRVVLTCGDSRLDTVLLEDATATTNGGVMVWAEEEGGLSHLAYEPGRKRDDGYTWFWELATAGGGAA
jgi:hypothetical protein